MDQKYTLAIPAGPLPTALIEFSKQTHLQILSSGERTRGARTEGLSGTYTLRDALTRLLKASGLRFKSAGADAVAIESGAAPSAEDNGTADDPGPRTGEEDAQAPGRATSLEEVIVSARKRDESLAEVPMSITVFTSETMQNYNIQSFNDYGTKVPNLSFDYGSGALGVSEARTVAIRGITGQNFTGTAGATGFYIDDTPLPGSIDPRVLDIDNIEVLKGPQGTLFGESSLGGNVRLITKKTDLTENGIGYMAEAGATAGGGSADGGANVIGNLVLIPGTLGVRAVLFGDHDAGYLTRTYPSPTSPAASDPFLSAPRQSVGDQGAVTTYGGSVALTLKPVEQFDINLRFMWQESKDYGFPATFAPLPSYTPVYTLDRAFDVQPSASDNWALPSLEVHYEGNGWSVVSSTSYFYRHTRDTEDSTYGTQQILQSYYGVTGLPPQPYLWEGEHFHNQSNEELRLSFDPFHDLSGTVGFFYSDANTKFAIPNTYAIGLPAATVNNTVVGPWPNDLLFEDVVPVFQKDTSIFGELYYKFLEQFTLTLGARQYWLRQGTDYVADGFLNFGPTPSYPIRNSEHGVDPKFGLAYQATPDAMVYTTASKGFRAGAAQPDYTYCALGNLPVDSITHVRSDTLWSYELGTKVQLPHPGLLVSAAAFHIDWDNPQQQVALPCGLYVLVNGKKSTINGGELEIDGAMARDLQVRFGLGYEKTDFTDPGVLSVAGIEAGSRITGVPAWNLSLGGVYTHALTETLEGFASADYSYVGNSVSLLNSAAGLEATRPAYSLVNLRIGVRHATSEISLNVRNLTNAKPNLGDIGYDGYAQFNASGVVVPQVATMQPLTVLLRYQKFLGRQ